MLIKIPMLLGDSGFTQKKTSHYRFKEGYMTL